MGLISQREGALMNLLDLDDETGARMAEEVASDVAADNLYLSPRLSPEGVRQYPNLHRRAAEAGTDATLAVALSVPGTLNAQEPAAHPKGGPDIVKAVPVTAPHTLAEGEFKRFYARAACVRAVDAAGPDAVVTIYRARHPDDPRQESVGLRSQAATPGG